MSGNVTGRIIGSFIGGGLMAHSVYMVIAGNIAGYFFTAVAIGLLSAAITYKD